MKNSITLFSLVIISTLLSCKKSIPTYDTGGSAKLTQLIKVTGQTSAANGGVPTTVTKDFFYDNAYNLIKIKDGKKTTNLTYSKDAIAYQIDFADSTENVVKRRTSNVLQVLMPFLTSKTEELYYEGDKLINTTQNVYNYTNELLTEVQISAAGVVQQLKKYTYTGKNITSFDDGKGNVYNYKYNDKLNPYYNRRLKHLTGEIDFASPNLATEIEYNLNGSKTVVKLTYTYNAEGYPLTAKGTDAGGNILMNYAFEYRVVIIPGY